MRILTAMNTSLAKLAAHHLRFLIVFIFIIYEFNFIDNVGQGRLVLRSLNDLLYLLS